MKAAIQDFVQAFPARQPYPDKYDMLMDIATEEFSHREIVGATIQMLLNGINGELKNAAEESEIMQTLKGKAAKEEYIHQNLMNPECLVNLGGSSYQLKWRAYGFQELARRSACLFLPTCQAV